MGNRFSVIKHDTEDIGFKQTNELKANIKTEQVNIKKVNIFFFLTVRSFQNSIIPYIFLTLIHSHMLCTTWFVFHFVALW